MVKPMIIYDNEEEFLSSDERFIGINDEIWQFVKDELHMTDENYWFDVENAIVLFSKAIAEKKFTAQQCIHYLLEREDITFAQVVIPELLKKDAANKFNQGFIFLRHIRSVFQVRKVYILAYVGIVKAANIENFIHAFIGENEL